MDTDDVAAVLAEIDADIDAAEETLNRLRLQRAGAEAFLARLNRHRGRATTTGRVTPSTAAEAGNKDFIAGLLVDYPEGLHLDKIQALAAEHGRNLNSEQVRSAVTYLKRRKQAETVSRGVWRLTAALAGTPRSTNAEAPVTAEASDNPIPTSEEGVDSREATKTPPAEDHVHPQLGAPVGGYV